VLADLAFMFTDEVGEPPPQDDADPTGPVLLETTISYHGPTSGTLTLRCPHEFAVLLAANLLGVDPEDEDSSRKARDAVGEFMNIVCGQFITAVHGTEQVFDLTLPQTRELPVFAEEAADRCSGEQSEVLRCALVVEGHWVELTYTGSALEGAERTGGR